MFFIIILYFYKVKDFDIRDSKGRLKELASIVLN